MERENKEDAQILPGTLQGLSSSCKPTEPEINSKIMACWLPPTCTPPLLSLKGERDQLTAILGLDAIHTKN
ncbi:hypothetical protein MHYP_G00211630 [Metynnis hypsauchen]